HALALRAGAGRDVDLSRRVDTDKGAFERADPGSLDITTNSEPEIPALTTRPVLTPTERLYAAERIERLLQGFGVIAAVVDDRLAVAIGDADPIGHFLGADHVAPAHFLRRLQAQGSRHQVDGPLHREGRFWAPGAAIGGIRNLVGDHDLSRGRQILDLVWAGQVDGGVVGDTGPDRVPGAAIDEVIVAQCEDAAVIVEPDFDVVQLIARMRRADQVLAPVFDPAHRPPKFACEERDQQVFRVDMALAAEATA